MAVLRDDNISEISSEEEISGLVRKNQFMHLGQERFQRYIRPEITVQDLEHQVVELSNFRLPAEYEEIFIDNETSKYYPGIKIPIINRYEEWMRQYRRSKGYFGDNIEEIRKYYLKWAEARNPKDREYYANSVLSLIEKNNNSDNFLKHLLGAEVHIYDSRLFSIEKAREALNKARDVLDPLSLEDDLKKQLSYMIELYEGFLQLQAVNFEEAESSFAALHSGQGVRVTAIYHNAYAAIVTGNRASAIQLINLLFDSDLQRLSFAVDVDNTSLFTYFLKYASLYHIFREEAFAELIDEVRLMLDAAIPEKSSLYLQLRDALPALRNMDLDKYTDDNIRSTVKFLERFIDDFSTSHNEFIHIIAPKIVQKYNQVIDLFQDKINEEFENTVAENLKEYSKRLQSSEKQISLQKDDVLENTAKLKQRAESMVEEIDKKYNEVIDDIEIKLETIEDKREYNPRVTFINAMTNNLFISVIIVIIGGIIEAVGWESWDLAFEEILSLFLTTGLKWGGIVFLLGTIVSVFAAISAVSEGKAARRRLLKKVTALHKQKEKKIAKFKEDIKKRIAEIERNAEARIEHLNSQLEDDRKEKEATEAELREELSGGKEELIKKLEKLRFE